MTAELPPRLFVTGTDTGVGKSYVAALLAVGLEAAYWKPVQSGTDADADWLRCVTGLPAERILPETYRLRAPLSPHEAAQREGVQIEMSRFVRPVQKHLIVEGAGGVMVPLDDRHLMIDLMVDLGLPVLVVARSELGTINHTLLTLDQLRRRGCPLLGVVVNGPPNPANCQAIAHYGEVPVLAVIDRRVELSPAKVRPFLPAILVPMTERTSHVWSPFTQMKAALSMQQVRAGRGAVLELEDGRQILDCISSWWVTLHGHGQPEIAAAVAEQAKELEQVIAAGFTHRPAEKLARRLVNALPAPLKWVFYSDDGSTAVEVALKLAYQFWRNQGEQDRTRFLRFEGAYHGDTLGAMSVGERSLFTRPFADLLFPTDAVPFPATWEGDGEVEAKEARALARLEELLVRRPSQYAAMILEPLVQGAGGMRMCRPHFLAAMQALLRQCDVLAIYDEVLTGFGRTGALFACEKAATRPDIICLAKGLTGGFLPMAATVCSERVFAAFYHDDPAKAFYHGHSYTANPLGCAAALASLDLLAGEPFRRLAAWQREEAVRLRGHQRLKRVRVCGTIVAVDVIVEGEEGYLHEVGPLLRERFLTRGFLLRPLGNSVYVLPPYCIERSQLASIYDCFCELIDAL